jgi:cell wall-associated NlpC family hydrolase
MPPAVNSCGRISVELTGTHPDRVIRVVPPRSFRLSYIPALVLFILTASGCTATSPRFTSHPQEPAAVRPVLPVLPDTVIRTGEEDDDPTGVEPDTVTALPGIQARISDTTEGNPAIDRRRMLGRIMELMGTRYVRRGIGKRGFDCSGFTSIIYKEETGITLPHSSMEQYGVGTGIDQDSLKFGDLVFFRIRGRRPSHVGIYVGDGLFAHVSLSVGVTVSLLSSEYYAKRYLGARRIVE